MTAAQEQVTWQELGGVLDALNLRPGYSISTGRAFAEVDGTLLWADCLHAKLDPAVPGANRLQQARVEATMRRDEAEREAELAAMTPEQREAAEDSRRRFQNMPDPPGWQMDHHAERHGATHYY